jgi:hypothetical protein
MTRNDSFPCNGRPWTLPIRLANDSGKEGNPGIVLLQKSKADYKKIWTYGEDSYPPVITDLPPMSGTPEPGKLADSFG